MSALSRFPVRLLPAVALAAAAATQNAPAREAVDEAAVAFFRTAGLEQSQVMEHLSWMCDVYGPRLTGSPNLRQAQKWAAKTFAEWGLQNAKVEKWGQFGRGWRCDRVVVEVVGENPWPVIAYPKAWSPSLPRRIEAEVVLASAHDADSLRAMDLTDKIVFVDAPRDVREPFDGVSRRLDAEGLLSLADQRRPEPRTPDRRAAEAAAQPGRAGAEPAAQPGRAGAEPAAQPGRPAADPAAQIGRRRGGLDPMRQARQRILDEKRPLAVVDRGSKGDYGTVFVQGASALADPAAEPGARGSVRDADAVVIPQFTFAVEHYNRICRILQKGLPVRLAIELQTSYFDTDLDEYNVTAEIPGTDPALKEQLVMLGGHFDSWHSGTGATDNGCGSAVAMEAVRLVSEYVKSTGTSPRRTIRVALWSGEEQGLLGSRNYVREHFGERGTPSGEHAQLSGYFNLDNGTGKVRGVYLQGNEGVAPIFRAWLRPFHDLGAGTLTLDNTGGTDHLAFDGVGLPGFQFIQDPVSYDSKTHHSNMDVWDHAVADDLKQASTIMASFVWHTAQRDEQLPRKPGPLAGEGGGRRGGR